MIEALVSGKLLAKPNQKAGKNSPFVLARLTASSHTDDSITVSVIAFSDEAQASLLAMDKGDQVTLSGKASPKLWTNQKGEQQTSLDLVANKVLTVHHASDRPKTEAA